MMYLGVIYLVFILLGFPELLGYENQLTSQKLSISSNNSMSH